MAPSAWFERIMGTAETRRLVRQNYKDKPAFMQAGHLYNQSPVAMFVYLYPITMLLVGMVKPEYAEVGMPPWQSDLVTAAKVLGYWGICWLVMGHFAWALMRRGLPFVVVPLTMWMIAVAVSQTASRLFDPDYAWSLTRFLRQSVLTLPGSLVIVHAIAPRLRETLGELPELVPIWRPITRIRVPLLLKLPPDKRGRLLRIHAANQYVEVVTDAGTSLLRMTLRQAVSLLPEDKGWLCHRSLWIRREEVFGFRYLRGQPQIIDSTGQAYPISRSSVAPIRAWLEERNAEVMADQPMGAETKP